VNGYFPGSLTAVVLLLRQLPGLLGRKFETAKNPSFCGIFAGENPA